MGAVGRRLPALGSSGPREGAPRLVGRAVVSAPLTFAYALLLLATTLVLRWASDPVSERLLSASSTDVAHLGHDPIVVLVASTGWLPGQLWLPYALVLFAVAAPLERRIGTARAALVFWSGHVLATMLTELPIAVAVSLGWAPASAAHRLDVGASYGTLTIVAAFVGGLSLRRGTVVLAASALLVAGVPTAPPDMSTYGHALCLVIGACWWPTLHGRLPWRRRARPARDE